MGGRQNCRSLCAFGCILARLDACPLMFPLCSLRRLSVWLIGMLLPVAAAYGDRVPLDSVEASFAERPKDLQKVIDGVDTGTSGWSLYPHTGEAQSLIVRTSKPIQAHGFDLTFCFLSGKPNRFCGDFTISFTRDPRPSLSGNWEQIEPQRFTATGTTLRLGEGGHLIAARAHGMIGDAIIQVSMRGPPEAVTGFRIDVFPFQSPDDPRPRMAWNKYLDICMTEFRVDVNRTATTNIALGCPVTASHPLWDGLTADLLTDGLPGSFIHPAEAGLGDKFYFEVDLGGIHSLDHISLRGRADGYAMQRMSRVLIRLYDQPPVSGAAPVWEALDRADGSNPEVGHVDVIRATDGRGRFAGRYIRLSSDSTVALSPQLAELEVYEALTARLALIKADGIALPSSPDLRVPIGAKVLSIELRMPGENLPERLPIRWRLRGLHDDWQYARELTAEVLRPAPGEYRFEAQIYHTDGECDGGKLTFPLTVAAPFWQRRSFYWTATGAALLGAVMTMRLVTRKRELRRWAEFRELRAIDAERVRLARDLHDTLEQGLTGIHLQLHGIGSSEKDGSPETQHRLDKARSLVEQCHVEIRKCIWNLRSSALDHFDLGQALERAARSLVMDSAIQVNLRQQRELESIPSLIEDNLLRIGQEALTNAVKHSQPTTLEIQLQVTSREVCLTIGDNGCGMTDPEIMEGHFGLVGMRERTERIGGQLQIRSTPGQGCTVYVRVPLRAAKNGASIATD